MSDDVENEVAEPNYKQLEATVVGAQRLDSETVEVHLQIKGTDAESDETATSDQLLKVPVPLAKAKSYGIGTEVVISVKKKSQPRAKKGSEEGNGHADEEDEKEEKHAAPPANAGQAPGRRRRTQPDA